MSRINIISAQEIINFFTKKLRKEKWKISRQIINYIDKSFSGIANGEAIFYKIEDDSALMHENVTVNWFNGSSTIATKSYLFITKSCSNNNASLLIYYFKNPLLFQPRKIVTKDQLAEKILMYQVDNIIFSYGLSFNSTYICGMDKYKLSCTILSPDSFSMEYKIKGLNKNYYIKSIYS